MNGRAMQFRVGVLVLGAMIVLAVLIVRFGEMPFFGAPVYSVHIRFPYAPGVEPEIPVRMSGIRIGQVRDVRIVDEPGQPQYVRVTVEIEREYSLREDSRPTITRSLLGDAAIEFTPGQAENVLEPGAELEGTVPPDFLAMAKDMGDRVDRTLQEWEQVGSRLNRLLTAHEEDLDQILERLALSLSAFQETMESANTLLADPQNQENFRKTLQGMPQLIADARDAVSAVRQAATAAQTNLDNLGEVTGALADHTRSVVSKLDEGATRANELLTEMTLLTRALRNQEGSLGKLAADPNLYNNLNRAAYTLAHLLREMEPVVADLQVFSDSIARYPELLGIGGLMQPSSGVKARPASVMTPQRQAIRLPGSGR